jgi:hypothetical protein
VAAKKKPKPAQEIRIDRFIGEPGELCAPEDYDLDKWLGPEFALDPPVTNDDASAKPKPKPKA